MGEWATAPPQENNMPIYEYNCKCGQQFEALRQMSEYREPATCPECGKDAGRIISSARFRMAETFAVVDSNGALLDKRQVTNELPAWDDPMLKKG